MSYEPTESKQTTITSTAERRIRIESDKDGVRIDYTSFEGLRAPTVSIFLTHAELAKIARKCLPSPKAKVQRRTV